MLARHVRARGGVTASSDHAIVDVIKDIRTERRLIDWERYGRRMRRLCSMAVDVRIATPGETGLVADILTEVAMWADTRGAMLWQLDEVHPRRLAAEVEQGLFHLAWRDGDAAGTVKFQLDDPEFWPDDPGDHAAYIHRLAVRRRYAGGEVSTALMTWAVGRAALLGRRVLRLDCDLERDALRAVYERFGFRYHSDRQVGPYLVARFEYRIV